MIRSRMQNSVEHLLTRTQYGFRPSKSTSHAIYLIRRIQDFAESKATKSNRGLKDFLCLTERNSQQYGFELNRD